MILTISAASTGNALLRNVSLIALLLVLMTGHTPAQTVTTTSSTDGTTPAGMQAGSPAGSYALSGFDNINPFNGNLSFNLPLLKIGGRGSAGYTMTLPIEKKWRVEHITDDPNIYCETCEKYEVTHTYSPTDQPWGMTQRYGAGVLQGRRAGKETFDSGGTKVYTETLTRLTFTAPDSTEYELRDALHAGKPIPAGANPLRGTVFVTADATSATFISDAPISDYTLAADHPPFYPSGYLLTADGTRYRIENGDVVWIRDRNGNKVRFGNNAAGQYVVTDSLGREVTVGYHSWPAVPYDEIKYKGVGGAARYIRVHYDLLSAHLRSGYSINTYSGLFPSLGGSSYTNYNPLVVSSVELPDGRSYNFFYNSYGEIARVELPTGGAFEYDFQGSDGTINLGAWSHDTLGPVSEYEIHRRATTKRVYKDGGALESRTEFTGGSTGTNTEAQVSHFDANNNLLASEKHYYYGAAYPSLTQFIRPTHYARWDESKEYKTETLAADGATVLHRIEQTWRQRAPVGWWNADYGPEPANDPRVVETITTLAETNQVSKQTSINPQTGAVGFDQYNNQTDVWEYDYGTGAPPARATRHTHTDFLTINPANGINYAADPNVHVRALPTAQRIYSVDKMSGAETLVAQSETRYDEGAYPLLTYTSVTGWNAPGTPARGLATTMRTWLDTSGTWLETHAQYDQLGNVRNSWDAHEETATTHGRLSQMGYADSFSDGNNTRNTYAFPTTTTSPIPDPSNTHASNTPLTTSTVYDFSTGKVTATIDVNGKTTTLKYVNDQNNADPLDRLRKVEYPDGGWVKYNYSTTIGNIYVRTLTRLDSTRSVESYQFSDGLGRSVRSFLNEGGSPVKFITTDTQYDALGRVWRVSNPYRTGGSNDPVNPSQNWTTTTYDALGRVSAVTTPDDAQITTSYRGNTVTVTDQAGKLRRSVTDALGRLVRVDEPDAGGNLDINGAPAQATLYSYDALGNLLKVEQGGQLRFFMYDSLGRLVRAKNPEQEAHASLTTTNSVEGNKAWSLGYTYDANGNLYRRTDARGVTTTYTYDNLNRNTTVAYTNEGGAVTPGVTRYYDGAASGRGRVWKSEAAGVSKTSVGGYDEVGRPLSQTQQFSVGGQWSAPYTVTREYGLGGQVLRQSYPSGHAVDYSYDAAGRTLNFTGNLGDSVARTYSGGIGYDVTGGIRQEQFGTGVPLFNKRSYNVRGQLSQIRVGTTGGDDGWNRGAIINHYSAQSWAGSGSDNNGNLRQQDIFIPNTERAGYEQAGRHSVTSFDYTYDALNRLSAVSERRGSPLWTQAYGYDRYGNRTINAAATGVMEPGAAYGIPEPQYSVDAATNRLGVPGGQAGTMKYDAVGNLVNDSYNGGQGGGGERTYDAEGRMTSAQFRSGQTQTAFYTYDAEGRRVKRSMGAGGEVWQVYGMDGELLAEYASAASPASPQKEYGYRNGELLVTTSGASSPATVRNSGFETPSLSSGTFNYNQAGGTWTFTGGTGISSNSSAFTWANPAAPEGTQVAFIQGGSSSHFSQTISGFHASTSYTVTFTAAQRGGAGNQGGSQDFDLYLDQRLLGTFQPGSFGYTQLATASFMTTAGVHTLKFVGRNSVGGDNTVFIDEVRINATNVAAKITPVAATASSTYSTASPANAMDNNANTSWIASGVPEQWIEVDLGQSYNLEKVRLLVNQLPAGQTVHEVWGGETPQSMNLLGTHSGYTQTGQWLEVATGASGVRYAKVRTTAGPSWVAWAEVEVYGRVVNEGGVGIEWVVTDQLGTPRMVIDESGSLSGVKRHDYLPFGEEVGAGVGGRTTQQGYGGTDNVRQKFTGYERDGETNLDYAQARYYSSTQGRFTSPDPLLGSGKTEEPQSWNRYTYTINNPLKYVDPEGLRYVQRTLENGQIQYGWCADDECYLNAIDSSAEGYQGWTAVTFDESQPFSFMTDGIGGERTSSYTLMPDGTNGYTRILAGHGSGVTPDFGAQMLMTGAAQMLFRSAAGFASGLLSHEARGLADDATVAATTHGAEQLAARGFTAAEVALTKTGTQMLQRDGARVFLKEVGAGKFNVLVEGERGVVTALKNISEKSVAKLAKNYGWFSPVK